MLDTRVYAVIFPDGTIRQYSANTITENMYIQVEKEGKTMTLIDSITDHRRNEIAI